MMILADIIKKLEEHIEPSLAESWDNCGLQVGRKDAKIHKIMIALDPTDEVIQQCIEQKADLLLTHHPLLLGAVKQIRSDDLYGKKILDMAEHGIAHYAMHTNYDVARMGMLCAVLIGTEENVPLEKTTMKVEENGENIPMGIGTVGILPTSITVRECCQIVKDNFGLSHVRVFGDLHRKVRKIAVCPGSGKSLIPKALSSGAELYITGDIGHHDGIDALQQGLMIMDAGHYGLEHVFIQDMVSFVKEEFSECDCVWMEEGSPFCVI